MTAQNAIVTPYLKLPLPVQLSDLLLDLSHCLDATWRPHFNQRDYVGGWDSIALRSQDGQTDTVFAHPDSVYQDTPLLQECPHFRALLDSLPCDKESVRLLRQAPGGEIKTHRDQGLHYSDGVFRLHIPLITHDQVDFIIAGTRIPMQPGECWFGDFSQPHSVHNRGASERIHLVIDCIRNTWTDEWFAQAGLPKADFEAPQMDEATRKQVLENLRMQNNPALAGIIADLEAESAAAVGETRLWTMLNFLDTIGIKWTFGKVPSTTFLPGLEVIAGTIVIDRSQLKYPGDILHEAGHIALLPSEKREMFSGNVAETLPEHGGDEVGVILWSYAACLHLGLPVEYVIHDAGYHDGADWLRQQFAEGTFIGLPLLVWMGLCEDPAKEKLNGGNGFPEMLRWVRT
ncbi:MAG: aspartyl/asparaginyl beta-hydroxylase domain-containing protein [Bacteroidetes bacterium]|nr:aspartyl/asparaginyl beta-hydroxylase domain-containing protein [Bacteroidota bacterium]